MGSVSMCSMDCLPDDLLVKILSFLPMKEAVSTSLLSKRWRTLFASNLDFDDSIFYSYNVSKDNQKRFNAFVDRTLALQGSDINKFSLQLSKSYKVEGHVERWICYALEHGISKLHLEKRIMLNFPIPSKVFTSTTLVKLSLVTKLFIPRGLIRLHCLRLPPDTCLPALKVLLIDSICFEGNELSDVLLAACPVLEEFTLQYFRYYKEFSYVISNKTIKKLSVFYFDNHIDDLRRVISFDTPNVVDFYYYDYLGRESPQCHHFHSLEKATLDLHFIQDKMGQVQNGANVTDLMSGIRNVKTLHLTSYSVEVILVCCKGGLPVFNNLVDLVFSSKSIEGWNLLLPRLLQRSPNLQTLVLSGLDCFPCRRHRFIWITPKNQIKMLLIKNCQGYASELKHIRHFLLKMECLQVVKVYVAVAMDDSKKMQLTEDLLKFPAASSKLKIQVI